MVNVAYAANPTATSLAPVNPIREGDILGFYCQIRDLESHHSVIISRQVSTENIQESLSWNDDILADVDERIFLARRQQLDGSDVYFLVVNDVSRTDAGSYFCQVLDRTQGKYILVEEVMIDVIYLPSANNPYCSPSEDYSVTVGRTTTFNCSTEAGRPSVIFNWNRVSDASAIIEPSREFTDGNIAYSEVTLDISSGDMGAVFLCRISSTAFPAFSKRCFIGPLNVKVDDDYSFETSSGIFDNDDDDDTTLVIPREEQTASGENTCVVKSCPLFNEASVFWISAFWAASLVTIILIAWIVYIHKQLRDLQRTSRRPPPEFHRPPVLPGSTSSRGHHNGEDIYVEMSSKSGGSTCHDSCGDFDMIDRTYMTLEKPRDFVPYYPTRMPIVEEETHGGGGIDTAGYYGDVPRSPMFARTCVTFKGNI